MIGLTLHDFYTIMTKVSYYKREKKMEVLVIGLDGAPYHLLEKVSKRMPTLANLMNNGSYGILTSTIPALSLLAWPVFYTGKNPGKIGVYVTRLVRESVEEVKLPTSHDVKAPAIWEILSNHKKKVGVVNIPVTYPPKPVNGFLITGFLTPPSSDDFVYPAELKTDLGEYTIDLDVLTEDKKLPERDVDKSVLLQKQYDITEKRAATCLRLIRNHQPDFFIVNFKGLDNMQHLFWHKQDVIVEFYERLETLLKQFIDTIKPKNTVIMSDHGFHARSTKYFHINTYLEREGFLYRNKSLKGRFSILTYTVGVKLVEIFPFIRNLVPEKAKSSVGIKQMTDRIDWSKTLAYADFHRGIFINKEITGAERDKVAQAIVEKMMACEDPQTGNKVFKVVKRKEEIFSGPYFDLLPDIVWLPDADYRVNANLFPKLISPRLDAPHISGEHMAAADGIFILKGPGVVKNKRIEGAHISDLAPTILYMMDVPIPSDIDGKVLRSAFEPSHREPQYAKAGEAGKKDFAFTQKEEKKLEERLKGLGYL